MTNAVAEKRMNFEESIIRSASNTISSIDFIREKQQLALRRIENFTFPSNEDEDWKYYDFADLLNVEYNVEQSSLRPLESGLSRADLNHIVDKYVFAETVDNFLVTVNGAYSQDLSNFNSDDNSIEILDFNNPEQLEKNPIAKSLVQKYFAYGLEAEQKYFKLVNNVLLKNGFLLHVKENASCSKPLQILHISNQNTFNQMRSLIYLGKNSNLKLIVTYVGLEDSRYFTNAVIECFLEENAQLKLDKIQNESKKAISLYSFFADLKKNSNFEFNSFNFGSKSSREDIHTELNGDAANASINGLYVVNQERKSHHKVSIFHNQAHTKSEQLFKGLLEANARAEFNGLIEVTEAAQKTDASQLNKNILLSKNAHIDSRPQLNILTDDVKCSHGSTVGRLNQEEIFYLKSRGLTEDNAKTVLTYSFCQELIDKVDLASVRNYISNLAFSCLKTSDRDDHGLNTLALLANNSKFKKSKYDV